jgi:beta-lactamase class D
MRLRTILLALLPVGVALAAAATRDVEDAVRATLGPAVAVAELRDCDAAFEAAGVTGTFVLYRPSEHSLRGCRLDRADNGYLPASTFKIPNALIALEVGSARDEHEVIAWDGVQRRVPDWNCDHDLASAMQVSAVWYYQELARRTGAPRMGEWVGRLDYGNADIGGRVDSFWLDGRLRVSALQQVAFLARLRDGSLPLSARSQQIVRDVLVRDRGDGWVLHAKTGWADSPDPDLGWFVGWLERDGLAHVFALNLDLRSPADAPQRERLARRLLAGEGLIPMP